jgi:hypothetical protein
MTTKKILDHGTESVPGGNPNRPTRGGVTRVCCTTKCSEKEYKGGLCSDCWSDFVKKRDKGMTVDDQNEAWDRARNS